mmetsp:Transcript_76324/g.127170  ORF Transcript_76324/g.127170 Transcript_76324/m.127170 type:complete len:154 (+) Transcript_76324:94-555(+)
MVWHCVLSFFTWPGKRDVRSWTTVSMLASRVDSLRTSCIGYFFAVGLCLLLLGKENEEDEEEDSEDDEEDDDGDDDKDADKDKEDDDDKGDDKNIDEDDGGGGNGAGTDGGSGGVGGGDGDSDDCCGKGCRGNDEETPAEFMADEGLTLFTCT